jgi:hypothetical protein
MAAATRQRLLALIAVAIAYTTTAAAAKATTARPRQPPEAAQATTTSQLATTTSQTFVTTASTVATTTPAPQPGARAKKPDALIYQQIAMAHFQHFHHLQIVMWALISLCSKKTDPREWDVKNVADIYVHTPEPLTFAPCCGVFCPYFAGVSHPNRTLQHAIQLQAHSYSKRFQGS